MDGSGQVVSVLRGDGPPGEHEGLAVADVLVDKRLGVKSRFGLARRGPVDEHGRVAGVSAGNLEEVAPAVGLLVGRIAVRYVLAIEVGLYRREAVGAFIRKVPGDFEDIAVGEPVSARQLLGVIREVEEALLRIGTDAHIRLAGHAEPETVEQSEIASDGVFNGIDRLARVEPAAHAGRVLERPSAEILQEIDPELGTREVGGGQVERPRLKSLGIRPGGVVDLVAQKRDLDQVRPVVGHRAEQRDSVAKTAAPDDFAGIGMLWLIPLVLAAGRYHIDGIHGAVDVAARDSEEIVPAVRVRMALGRVLHIGISKNTRIVPSVCVHIDALQFAKAGTLIPEMVGPPSRDAARRPVRFPNGKPGHFLCRLVGVSLPEPVFLRIDLAAWAICGGVFS